MFIEAAVTAVRSLSLPITNIPKMPTLAECNSIFQLAVGINAVLPAVLSGFEETRMQAAELFLRKIRECRPDFELKERDRPEFVNFVFQSVNGLRYARRITRFIGAASVALAASSLGLLVLAALEPLREISREQLYWFVLVSLIVAPALYMARNSFLKWLYGVLVRNVDSEAELQLFASCVDTYLSLQRRWRVTEPPFHEAMAALPIMRLKLKWSIARMRVGDWWYRVTGR